MKNVLLLAISLLSANTFALTLPLSEPYRQCFVAGAGKIASVELTNSQITIKWNAREEGNLSETKAMVKNARVENGVVIFNSDLHASIPGATWVNVTFNVTESAVRLISATNKTLVYQNSVKCPK